MLDGWLFSSSMIGLENVGCGTIWFINVRTDRKKDRISVSTESSGSI